MTISVSSTLSKELRPLWGDIAHPSVEGQIAAVSVEVAVGEGELQLGPGVQSVVGVIATCAWPETVHLPVTWPWEQAWIDLFTRVCGPPLAPAT